MTSSFNHALETLAARWPAQLGSRDPLQLGAYVRGWALLDARIRSLIHDLTDTFDGPAGADCFTRAYLRYPDADKAFDEVLRAISDLAADHHRAATASGSVDPYESYLGHFSSVLAKRRLGLLLGEPTLAWLVANYHGYSECLSALSPGKAATEASSVSTFEASLARDYSQDGVPWWTIIRAYHGGGEAGLNALAEHWATHSAAMG